MKARHPLLLAGLAALLFPFRAAAEDEPVKTTALDVGVGVSSAYVWRGYNIFQESKQMDQHAMLAPSLTLAFPATGLSVGYWGAYQLNGDNKSAVIDVGLGAEQDLILGFKTDITEQVAATFGLTYYFYPFADEAVAGTSVPSYLEPAAGVTFATFADLGLNVAYFHGLQDAIKLSRHVYVNPSIAKSLSLGKTVSLEPKLGFGYKIFNESAVEDNVYDVLLSVRVPVAASDAIKVTPNVNAAWTNLSDVPLPGGGVEERGFGDEYVVWAGLDVSFAAL